MKIKVPGLGNRISNKLTTKAETRENQPAAGKALIFLLGTTTGATVRES
jgi:hypothetical protein